jgi:selenide,water dikinase
MARLNKTAAEIATKHNVRSGTDVTGFSLLGHALEMANTSGVGFQIHFDQIPMISCANRFAEEWTFAGGAFDNRDYYGPQVTFNGDINEAEQMLLFDPQTSGGLLLCIPSKEVESLQAKALEIDQPFWMIGEVVEGSGIKVWR